MHHDQRENPLHPFPPSKKEQVAPCGQYAWEPLSIPMLGLCPVVSFPSLSPPSIILFPPGSIVVKRLNMPCWVDGCVDFDLCDGMYNHHVATVQ